MELMQLIVLAIVQGLTEFLPISSSAHLILARELLGWAEDDQSLAFDLAVHLGSLLAVLWYFRREVTEITLAWFRSLAGQRSAESKLAWAVILGTIPACLIGLLAKGYIEDNLRTMQVIAMTTLVFGLLLWFADRIGKRERDEYSIGWRDALFVGLAQAVALIPGTSRSGITITAGLLLGLDREAAARFSFLLSIPIILLSSMLLTLDLAGGNAAVAWGDLGLGVVFSAISAYACIGVFMALIKRIGMLPFVLYRVALAGLLFALL